MERPEEVIRKYRKTDLLLLEQSQTMHDIFATDLADFVARFPLFANPFVTDWQTKIDVADAFPSDENVLNELNLLNIAVEEVMLTSRNQYQTLLVYLGQAYPNDAGVLKLFGHEQYDAASRNQLEMIELLELVAAKANTAPYKAALIAKGFLQADINMLKTTELDLRAKNKAQEAGKTARSLSTQNRIIAHNAVWDMMVLVNEAAQVIYSTNYAKLQQYLLYPEAGTPTPTPSTGFIDMDIDQTVLENIFLKIAGNATATGVEQVNIDHGDGYESVATLINGNLVGYTISYITSGIFHAQITPITAGALSCIGVLQFDNCKLTGTLAIPAAVQPSGIQIPNNHVTHVNMQSDCFKNLSSFVVFNNDMVESSVNANLLGLDGNNLLGGIANFGGGTNAAPTGAGLAAKNNLIAKGWTVITN